MQPCWRSSFHSKSDPTVHEHSPPLLLNFSHPLGPGRTTDTTTDTTMLASIARRSVSKAALSRPARSLSTINSQADTNANNAVKTGSNNISLSFSAPGNAAAAPPANHVQTLSRQGRMTSLNRTFHHSASWDAGSDLVNAKTPAAQKVQDKMEQARLRRYKNAIEML